MLPTMNALDFIPLILFEGEEKPRMTMSKYDFKNNKFLEHYACTVVRTYID